MPIHLKTLHPLKDYTTLKIGGLARFFCVVESIEDYLEALELSAQKKLPLFVLGKGSNVLFVDEVFEALVVLNKLNHIVWDLPQITCGSAFYMSLLASKASRKGYSGLEGASGIPATVGGAIFMNAGAGHFETKNALVWVKSINSQGEIIFREKKDLTFSYRHSLFQDNQEFIVEACFELIPLESAWDLQQSIIKKRIATQPYKDPSAGCFFKNPQGFSAGALIDQAGLKGFQVAGASVSHIHANFLINHNEAKASDLLELARVVQEKVFETKGVHLEQEVRLIGNFMYEKV
jgi:UDP-N-acetylmuramate dehydrogenase